MTPLAWLGIAGVRVYQYTLRGLIGSNCRFLPSCSDYAIDALRCHGGLRGGAMAGWRILRCNPWNAGGYDPVPGSARDAATNRTGVPEPGAHEPALTPGAGPENRQMGH